MVFRRHKKKTLFGLFLLTMIILFFALLPRALKPVFEIALRKSGFPKAHIENLNYLSDGLYVDKILLDPNGFTEIDDLEIRGNWIDLIIHRHADRINIKTLNLTGELDKQNRITVAGWDGSFAGGGRQSALPFKSLNLQNFTADLDTGIGGIRVKGKANIDTDNQNNQIITSELFSSQQPLTTTLSMKSKIEPSGNFSGKIDIEDTSVNIKPISVSRMSGWIEFKNGSTAGQIVAGGIKYKDLPFEDANLAFDTAQTPAATFKTKMTGQNLSISADLTPKPQHVLSITAVAANIGELAQLADVQNDILSASGQVTIKASVKLNNSFLPAGQIDVAEIKSAVAGGFADIGAFTYYGDGRTNSLKIELQKMQFSQLLAKDSSVQANGSVSGVIPLTYKGSVIEIHNGVIHSDQPGSFKYTPTELPAALQGNDSRMETVRKALSHYNYDTLEMTLDGPINGNLKTSLKATGKSPAFDDRPVNLNLNLEGALTSAFTQALKPGALDNSLKNRITKEQK